MFDDLIFHPLTLKMLSEIAKSPSQGYFFLGPKGSGKFEAANRLAMAWSNKNIGHIHKISPENNHISIDQIHSLLPLLAHRVPENTHRAIIIDQSSRLTLEAQSSLLKALEEPGGRTTFILVADDPSDLLPTVRSRMTELNFAPIEQGELIKWAKEKFQLDEETARRYYYLGGATPGGITRIVDDDGQAISLLETARSFLQSNSYERIKILSNIQGRDRREIREFVSLLAKLLSAALNNLKTEESVDTYRQFGGKLTIALEAMNALDRYANPRIILSQLVLEL